MFHRRIGRVLYAIREGIRRDLVHCMKTPKIAIIHDHLTQFGGAEQVLRAFHELYPEAPIYTLVYDEKKMKNVVPAKLVRTSFLQRLPGGLRYYQWFLPIMPTATEKYDLTEFDIVLSSSSAFSKGVITRPDALHVCYCHTPTRYLWTDTHHYIKELTKGRLFKPVIPFILSYLRLWDRLSADRVDHFIANSQTVADRITKYYRRSSTVIYPPVEIERFTVQPGQGTYFLAGGRLVAYKRFDLIIEAFNKLNMPLKIFGIGPEDARLRAMAKSNIEFLGKVGDDERTALFESCIAFIHPQEEDLGITPLEAMSAGKPVIAYGAGGALETVLAGKTGEFFEDQDWPALVAEIMKFHPENYHAEQIRAHAMQFSKASFKKKIKAFIDEKWTEKNTS